MKRIFLGISGLIISVFLITCFLYSAKPVAAQKTTAAQQAEKSYSPDEILIKTKKGIKSYSVNSVKGAFIIRQHAKSSVSTVKLPSGTDLQEAIKKYKADPTIEYAEPNYVRRPFFLPNDPNLSQQWYIDKVRAKEAWDITKGNSQVVVAVIDTGVDYGHLDLQDKIVSSYNSMINSTSISDVMDDVGHGTIVAGEVAGALDNGIGIAGVGGNIRVMPIKAGDSLGFTDWDIANGIYWAVDNGARVINMSLGGDDFSYTLEAAVNYAVSHNVVVIAAAGNNGLTTNKLSYPAAFSGVIGVAATTQEDTPAGFSNHGSYIDVSAPGVDIYSTTPRNGIGGLHGYYDYADGTSMASPIVAGLAGLIISINPSLSGNEVANAIFNGTQDLGPQGWDEDTGWGRVDAYKTLSLLTDSVPPSVLSVDPANNSRDVSIDKTITVYFSEDVLAGSNFSGITLSDGSNNPIPVNTAIYQTSVEVAALNPLTLGQYYTLAIPGGALMDKVYNSLQANFTSGFYTQDYILNNLLEPNDTMQTATAIVANHTYSATFDPAGDKDYYIITVPGAGQVHFSIGLSSTASSDASVTVNGPAGAVFSTTLSGDSADVQLMQVNGFTGDYYILFESANGSPWTGGEGYNFVINMQQELGGWLRDTQGLTANYSNGEYKAVITPIDVPGYTDQNPILITPDEGGNFSAGVLPAGIYRVSAQHPGNYISADKIVYANGVDMDFIDIDLWAGDVNGDGIINSSDIDEWGYAATTGPTPSSPNWNTMADLNKDQIIDMEDLVHIAVNFSRQKTELVQDPWQTVSTGSSSGAPTNILIQPSKSQVAVNEVFTVAVNISNSGNTQGVVAADLYLTYDPSKLQLQDSSSDIGVQVANGPILDQYTNRLIWNDSIPGLINYGGTRLASGGNQFIPVTSFAGNNTLFFATFKALHLGPTTISLDSVDSILLNRHGSKIAYNAPDSVIINVRVLNSVSLDSASYSLNVGNTHQTVVTAVYSDSSLPDVTQYASYTSSNPQAATVNQNGLVTAIAAGSTIITATYNGHSAQATVTVSGGSSPGGSPPGSSPPGSSSSGSSSSDGSSPGGGGGAAPAVAPSIAPVTNAEQKISSSGGKLNTPSATVNIPKGALTTTKTITAFGIDQSWVSTPNPAGHSYASEIIEFGPSGTVFSKPITITMKYDSTRIGLNDIFPYYLNEKKKVWERINGARIDRLNGTISFETTHFSKYTVMTPDKPNTNFSDTKNHWAKNLIVEYVARGAISGVVPGKFGPDNKITRAEFCKLLMVALNFNINASVNPFNDISEKDWFYSWVVTASNLGIVKGYNYQFKPYAFITREEMAVMILKALDAKGKYITSDDTVLKKFKDRSKVSGWAKDSVSQAVKGKIINGRSSTVLAPRDNATKAEAIAMVKKVENLLK